MAQPVPQRRNLDDVGEFTVSGKAGDFDRATGKRPPIDLTDIDTDRTLSRQHARIVKRDAGYFLREEAGTRNGTLLDGTKLKPGEDALLTDGDQLRFAAVVVRFQHR